MQLRLLPAFLLIVLANGAAAFDWSTTEMQYQYGNLERPFIQADTDAHILTFQHADGWRYGDNFLFVDVIDPDNEQVEYYGEYYGHLSLEKITGREITAGPITDAGFLMGINFSPEPEIVKLLPGLRLVWTLPGFAFLNTDFTAYTDASEDEVAESDSFMIDVNGRYPFSLGVADFSIEGHVEYIGERDNRFGTVREWLFSQLQFRYDLGKGLFSMPQKLFIGTEWQYWNNKLGTDVDENTFQALLVWRF